MGIATPPPTVASHRKVHNSFQFSDKNKRPSIFSMSEDYHHQGSIFSFSNGFERSQQEQQQQHHNQQQQQQQHIAQQIRRDKLRVQGFDPPPPLVGIEEEETGGIPVYEPAGMLSEMFGFPSGGASTATELLENQILQSYRNPRAGPPPSAADWFSHHRQGMVVGGGSGGDLGVSKHNHHHQQQQQHQISGINADSAAAMQLFLMNPPPQQQRSPSPSTSHQNPPHESTSSTLHMLLPNPSSSSSTLHHALHNAPPGGAFGQFTWLQNSGNESSNPSEINPGVVEGQGLSLSLSSSLQHLEAAKAEELRMGEGGMLFFGQGGGGSTPATQYQFKNSGGGGIGHSHQLHVGMGSSFGSVNMLRSSKYAKAAQELLEEFCSVGRGHFKKSKLRRGQNNNNNNNNNNNGNPSAGGAATSGGGGGGGNSSSSSKDIPPLSAGDRLEHQRRKVKLLSMLDEVDRRYNHYCEQMQMVVNSFDMVMGFGAAVPYTCLAQKAMSRHFRCLKDAIAAQLKNSCELLGEKDAGTSGVTKGETPRLRMLEQSLRQQRAFHQMGMMEQEAWRPQRGLPERSVNILRAWLFEHFLHPYPSDADKHLLARQTGLSRNQVSNWFINARVRLWKPMVEEMYQQEAKDDSASNDQNSSGSAQTPTPPSTAATTTAITPPPPPPPPSMIIRSDHENDPSYIAINSRQVFSENQPPTTSLPSAAASSTAAHSFPTAMHDDQSAIGATTFIRFGANAGDVSLTLGLRHAGNMPEKNPFSVRDFGGC